MIRPRLPCSVARVQQQRFALLFRGQALRSSCTNTGLEVQLVNLLSYELLLAQPLEEHGSCLDLFLPLQQPLPQTCSVQHVLDLLGRTNMTRRVMSMRPVNEPTNQGESFRFALDTFLPYRHHYATLIIARYDVTLCVPLWEWSCNPWSGHRMSIVSPAASALESWEVSFRTIVDVLFIVPKRRALSTAPAPHSTHFFRPLTIHLAFS